MREISVQINKQQVKLKVSYEVFLVIKKNQRMENRIKKQKHRREERNISLDDILDNPMYFQTRVKEGALFAPSPEEEFFQKESVQTIMDLLKECSTKQRERFLKYAIDGISIAEIAREDECDRKNIWDSIRIVQEKLKKALS